jgi:hypothetical protein
LKGIFWRELALEMTHKAVVGFAVFMTAETQPLLPICPHCGEPCSLEDCVTDTQGRAMHKECYRAALIKGQEDL